ncbi:MAG: peptide ABC transporter [Alphaproteobacteria bacterium]|nr:peptide ABC transporter [Alphaproteobacteria bacterium]
MSVEQPCYPVLTAQLVKLSIVPKAYVERIGNQRFNQEPMGSGPYKFASIQRGVKTTLTRNDAYWGAKGPFPTVEFQPVPDVATRVANLRTGKSDLIVTITPDQANELKNDARTKVLSVQSERVAYFMLNALTGPTQDLRVRQAIAHAIDKNAIVTALLGGYDKVSHVIASPAHVGYAQGFNGYAFDPAKAKALLAQAGDAARAEMTLFTSPTFDQRIVTAIHGMLTDVGLKVKITSTDFPNWLKRAQSAPAEFGEMTFSRWSCGCQDADGIMYPLLHSSSQWAKMKDARMDQALDAARSELDTAKRVQHYAEVSKIVEASVPLVPLYQAAILYGARKELRWTPTPNESLFINRMGWDG